MRELKDRNDQIDPSLLPYEIAEILPSLGGEFGNLAGMCKSHVAALIEKEIMPRVSAASTAPVVDERPTIICLCGSTRFIEQFAITTWELERKGLIVLGCTLLPMWYCKVPSHFGEATGTKEQCDELHLRKIDLADEVLVLNIGGYIGESTRNEIAYAAKTGKIVRYLEAGPDPAAAFPAAPARCQCGADKDDPVHSTSTEFQESHVFAPTPSLPAREAAKEIAKQFDLVKEGWVTFGRVRIDRETETETFERTSETAVDKIAAIISRYFPAAETVGEREDKENQDA